MVTYSSEVQAFYLQSIPTDGAIVLRGFWQSEKQSHIRVAHQCRWRMSYIVTELSQLMDSMSQFINSMGIPRDHCETFHDGDSQPLAPTHFPQSFHQGSDQPGLRNTSRIIERPSSHQRTIQPGVRFAEDQSRMISYSDSKSSSSTSRNKRPTTWPHIGTQKDSEAGRTKKLKGDVPSSKKE